MRTCSRVTVRDLPSERKCMRLFHRLVFDTVHCPTCSLRLHYTARYAWCSTCRKKIRVKAVTWLKGSNLSFQQLWLLVLAWQTKQSPGAVRVLTGLSYTATRRWFTRFRDHLPKSHALLTGAVEVDEAFFGRAKFGNQTVVLGARARTGEIRLATASDREGETLTRFVGRHITKDSLLLTDSFTGYLHTEKAGFARKSCNHALGTFSETAGIENIWSRAKRQQRRQYGVFYPFYLKGLLREWEVRHNQSVLFTNPEAYLAAVLVPY